MPYIAGIGINHPAKGTGNSLEELVFGATSAALHDAGLTRAEIDGVCLASSDQLDGRAISSMHLAGPSGARLHDEIKLADDGSLAAAAAIIRIEAGASDRVIAVSWTKPDASDTAAALSVNPEPVFTRPVGLHPWVAEAMVIRDFLDEIGLTVDDVDAFAQKLPGADADDSSWISYPLRARHQPPPTESAVAIVFTADPTDVAVGGLRWGADSVTPTYRPRTLGSLASIASRAYAEAGLTSTDGIPVETTDRSIVRGWMNAVGLGLIEADELAGLVRAGGFVPGVNQGGGLWASNPTYAAGLECFARAAQHVRDGAASSIAHSNYGYAGQGNLVAVVGKALR